jgi:hypothetical protein
MVLETIGKKNKNLNPQNNPAPLSNPGGVGSENQ